MKKASGLIVVLVFIGGALFSQQDILISAKIRNLLPASFSGSVFYQSSCRTIQLNDLLVPVTGDVILETEKGTQKAVEVVFYFQEGKAVCKINDPSYRRAMFRIQFTDKKNAVEFIDLYKKL